MKLCKCCEAQKPVDDFYKSRGAPCSPCKSCVAAKAAAWATAHPERAAAALAKHRATKDRSAEHAITLARQKQLREEFPDAVRAKERAWYAANRERLAASKLEQRQANPERFRAAQRRYRETEQGKAMQMERKHERRARLLRAIPPWADRTAIADMFRLARILSRGGVKFSVDHIYPLKGKDVCGLHVFDNLQVMPLIDNIRKHARLPAAEGEHHR